MGVRDRGAVTVWIRLVNSQPDCRYASHTASIYRSVVQWSGHADNVVGVWVRFPTDLNNTPILSFGTPDDAQTWGSLGD